MKETPQEYIKRITSYVEGQQPLKVQAATPKKLARLIKGVPGSKLQKRPAPDKWSVVRNPRPSCRHRNRWWLSCPYDSRSARNAYRRIQSGRLVHQWALRQT